MTKKILIADDSVSMRQVISFTLSQHGYEVITANDGSDALSQAEEIKADMVITDLNMPKMNGIDLIKNLRKLPDYKFVPIIMLTTESQDAFKQAGKDAGATGWIVKPFKPDQLIGVIKKVLR